MEVKGKIKMKKEHKAQNKPKRVNEEEILAYCRSLLKDHLRRGVVADFYIPLRFIKFLQKYIDRWVQ
jgi:hypothetical protein